MSSIRGICIAALLAAATMSCGDSTAPKPGLVVTLSADSPAPSPIITDTPSGPRIACNVNLTAMATGKGTAGWTGATSYWFIGPDRTNSVGTTTNPSDDIREGFDGQGGISAGQTLHTIWYFYDSVPFEVKLGFAYQTDDGKTGTAWTRFRCGPDPATTEIPTITQLTVPSTTGEIAPGDTISVSYQETSSSGVWLSIVDITGAFLSEQVLGEHLATSVNRTVKFVVPQELLNPGVPLTVSLQAYDASLRGHSKSFETQLHFVDKTPPVISQPWHFAGQWAVGDTLTISATGIDDNLLGWFVYQIGPPANVADSVPALPGQAEETFSAKVVVKPEWVGTPTVSVAVRDAGGLTSQTLTSVPDSVRIYPLVSLPTTTPLSLSSQSGTADMAYDAKRDVMYVGLPADNRIAVVSPSTMTTQAPIAMPGAPAGMDLSLSGDSLLVAVPSANAIEVVDLNNPGAAPTTIKLSVLDTITPPGVSSLGPTGLRIAANGKMYVMLANLTTTNDNVVEVDLATQAQRIRTDARSITSYYLPWTTVMGRPDDRSRIYALGACGYYYDVATDSWMLCQNGGGSMSSVMGMTFDAAGTTFTRAGQVLNSQLQEYFEAPGPAAISPDGATVYFGSGQDIRTVRLSDLTMLARIPLPMAAQRLFPGPNGKWVLVFQTAVPAKVTRMDLQ